MVKATTSSQGKDEGPAMTPEEIKAKQAEIDAEIDKEYGEDPSSKPKEEPAEKLVSEAEPEQEQETPEETTEPEKELEPPEDPKEKRYREQLAGERKANTELQARLQALEAKVVSPLQQKEMTEEEKLLLAEKQLLKDKYGLIEKQEVLDLLDSRLRPVQKKREDAILQSIYAKFPDVSPDKDPTNEKWSKVVQLVNRFMPVDSTDSLADYEERFEWAYEKAFGKKVNYAQARQTSYAGVGGGSSAAKSRTTVGKDKDAHLSPQVRAYKANLDAYFDEEDKREEERKKRK